MKPIPAFLFGAAVLSLVGFETMAQTPPPAPQGPLVTVSGSGDASSDPDEATVRLGIQAQAKTAKEAQAQANAIAQKVIADAVRISGDRKSVQTSDLSLYPQSGNDNKIVSYIASNVISVRLTDLNKVGAVVDAGIADGANNVQGVSFGLRDTKAAIAESLKGAVENARAKAEAIAGGFNMKLGDLVSVEEQGSPGPRPVMMEFRAKAADSTPVEAGQVETSAGVTVTYRLVR